MRALKNSRRPRAQFSPSLIPVVENMDQRNGSTRGKATSGHSKQTFNKKKNVPYNQKPTTVLPQTPKIKPETSFQTPLLLRSKKVLPSLPVLGQPKIEKRMFN